MSEEIKNMEYEELPNKATSKSPNIKNIQLIHNVPVTIKAELGSTMLNVEEILKLDINCIIELESSVGDLVPLYANDILIGFGEIVVVNDDIGIKVSKINVDEVIDDII